MTASPKLAFLAGSTRKASFNRKLAKAAADLAAERGFPTELIELADYPMPIFNGDVEVEEGPPENARRLRDALRPCQGIFIASPEYNASVTPLLKNTLDWMSRVREGDEPGLALFRSRVFAIGGASGGRFGAMRSLLALRQVLELGMGVLVLPDQIALSGADKGFDENGRVVDEAMGKLLGTVVDKLGHAAGRLTQ
jgi:chromate reductase, NAD(P)H dehydrogenase (quinone)